MNVPLQRAQVGEQLLSMHPAALDCTREETIAHLLSDLLHHCAHTGIDFDDSVVNARNLHREEVVAHCYTAA